MGWCKDCKGTGKVWCEEVGMYVLCFHPLSARRRHESRD